MSLLLLLLLVLRLLAAPSSVDASRSTRVEGFHGRHNDVKHYRFDMEGHEHRMLEHASASSSHRQRQVVVFGGVPDDASLPTEQSNGRLLNKTLNALLPGDTFIVPSNKTFHVMGGIVVSDIASVTIVLEGILEFSRNMDAWPRHPGTGTVMECLQFIRIKDVVFTSSSSSSIGTGESGGLLDGNGAVWWGIPFIGYFERGEDRPRLMAIQDSKDLLIENIFFKNSPYWTFWCYGVDGLEIRNSRVDARRDGWDGHDWDDLSAFNTDGFDVAGHNVWIHDSTIWNQDDCIAVKDNSYPDSVSSNMLFERIHASGLGLTIGSIGGTTVRNITFRDSVMHHTYKGIYMKFRTEGGLIENILYENITMQAPEQWPIWIGPAQQADSSDICAAHPCSLCWPEIPFSECNAPPQGKFANITLRDVFIIDPEESPGVIIASPSSPIENLVFDNVVVTNPPANGWWGTQYYKCEGVQKGVATGGTWPVPPCFHP